MLILVSIIALVYSGCATSPETEVDTMDSDVIDPAILTGIWQGVIKAGEQQLRLVFRISLEDGEWTATAESPDQGVDYIPVASVKINGAEIVIDLPAVAGKFEGEIEPVAPKIAGRWHQGGRDFALDLVKIEKVEKIVRPQDPVPPFPYDVSEVLFANEKAGITLAGTLTVPRGAGPFPAVILVSGSGAQNRDEEVYGHRPFLILADHLTRQGIAVLRYDDRGVGGSGGNPATATSKEFADDAYAAFSFLRNQENIDPERTGIIGHSEGGIIAPMLAAKHPEVGFIVLLGAPGIRGDALLMLQSAAILRAAGAPEEHIRKAAEINRSIYEVILNESDNEKATEKLGSIYKGLGVPEDRMKIEIAPLLTPWFRFFLAHDPAVDLANTSCPVLAVTGSLDVQAPAERNLDAIKEAVTAGGNTRITIVNLEGLNHMLQHAGTGLVEEYGQINETFAPEALETVSSWINGLGGRLDK